MIIQTKFPICKDSLDYTEPIGAINDDNSNEHYANEIEELFNRKVSYLELGCAGGSFIDLLCAKGHDAYGIEGTDHPLKQNRAAWKKHYNTRLFTCDLSKPFKVIDAPKFDVISNWEFMEHLPPESLLYITLKMYSLLSVDGCVLCGISMQETPHHTSIFPEKVWLEELFGQVFHCFPYSLKHKYREDYYPGHQSFFVILKPKLDKVDFVNESLKLLEKE
tara:strand:- start:2045 stop:2704 length:660 start_codon:yes stop_codon:yes gene_type:complete